MPVVSPWRICQGAVKSNAFVRKELEPIARTDALRHRRQAWPALRRCAAVTVASLPFIQIKGKTGGHVHLRGLDATPLISFRDSRFRPSALDGVCAPTQRMLSAISGSRRVTQASYANACLRHL